MALFETSVTLECTPEEAFDFFLVPSNRPRINPPEVGLYIVNAPDVLSMGSRLEFKVQGWGMVQQLVHEITAFDRPTLLIETQIKGPLKKLVHRYVFAETAEGQTLLSDCIEFEPPGGLAGLIVNEKKLLDSFEDGFYFRQARLQELLRKQA